MQANPTAGPTGTTLVSANVNGAVGVLNVSGGTLVVNFDDLDADVTPDPLPALCGGQTRIKGDINGDDVPDITLEGAAIPVAAPPVAAAGLLILSSHNTMGPGTC